MKKRESLYIGLDLGTTHIKAVAYNQIGEVKSISRIATPVRVTKEGGAYHLAKELWVNTIKVMRDCIEQVQEHKIKAIGIASAAEAGVLLDKYGEAVGPILAWYDDRPSKYLDYVKDKVPSIDFFKRTGLFPKPKYSLLKFIWMKEYMGEQWRNGCCWLHLADYIAYRLTGVKRSEISLASRTMLFNINTKKWEQDLIKEFDLDTNLFQEPIQSGQIVGNLTKEISEGLRLPEGLPVTIAGHDHIVGSFGIGSIHDGDVTNSCGTAETLVGTIATFEMDKISDIPEFTVGCHVIPNRYYTLLPVGTTGGIIEWFLDLMDWDYAKLKESLSKEKLYNNSLVFFPTPIGSVESDMHTQMGWFGGALSHSYSNQMALSLIHGLCYLFRFQIEYLNNRDIRMNRIMITGGSTQNPYWMQTKANILNKALHVVNDSEGVARGAAIMAAKATDGLDEIPIPSSYTVFPNEESEGLDEFYRTSYIQNIDILKKMKL